MTRSSRRHWFLITALAALAVTTPVFGQAIVEISCPADVTVECGDSTDPAATGDATATSTCAPDPAVTSSDAISGGVCPQVMTIVRTWSAEDACGNTNECVQTITIADTQGPVVTGNVPPNRTAPCELVPIPPLTIDAVDACDKSITGLDYQGETITPGPCPQEWTSHRTWSASDACGNETVVSHTMVVVDNSPPTLLGIGPDVTLACVSAIPTDVVTAVDGCSPPETIDIALITTTNDGSGCLGDPLVLTRNWTATDPCGNVATGSRTITVEDTEPPALAGVPASVAIECGPVPPPGDVTASDNCPDVALGFQETTTPGDCPQTYTITRTWTATDTCGQVTEATQTILIRDTTPPAVDAAPADVTVECDQIPVAPATLPAVDACDTTVTAANLNDEEIIPGDCAGRYTIVRSWTAMDACGHGRSVAQTITVVDTTPPATSAPPDITVTCDAIPVPPPTLPATDNCETLVAVFEEPEIDAGPCAGASTITWSWTAADSCGNATTVSQTVTVIDTTPPTIADPPPDLTLECDQPLPDAEPTLPAADACDAGVVETALVGSVTIPGACPGAATIVRTWTATDGCGNSASVTQTITVVDTTPPAPLDGMVPPNRTAPCELVPNAPLTIPAFDNCDDGVSVFTYDGETIEPGPCPQAYIIQRSWSGQDGCGNAATASQSIVVVDNKAPHIFGVGPDVTVACMADVPDVDVVAVTDNCTPAANVVIEFDEVTNGGAGCPGDPLIITRSHSAADPCGNVATLVRTITVVDEIAPVLIGVPADVDAPCDAVPPPADVTASDDCGGVTVSFEEETSREICPDAYTLTRTWTAVDGCGRLATAAQTVTVTDRTPPVVTNCPPDVAVLADAGGCDAVVDWTPPAVTDDCDPGVQVLYDIDLDDDGSVDEFAHAAPVYTFPIGTHRVIAVAADRCGNVESSCSFVVIVLESNELVVNLALAGDVASPLVRCLTFELENCLTGQAAETQAIIAFVGGAAWNVSVLVPCGEWTRLSVRDTRHTLRQIDEDDFGVEGSVYVADFTAAGEDDDRLIGGNANDDRFIDILDFGAYAAQFGSAMPPPSCPSAGPHTDFSGDQLVSVTDFTFIATNFLAEAEGSPCMASGFGDDDAQPVLSITIEALRANGLGHLTPADLNGDGVLDAADIATFLSRSVRSRTRE